MGRQGYRIRQTYHNTIANEVSFNPTIGSHGSNSSSSSLTNRSDDHNSNMGNQPSARANLFPGPRQSSPEMNRSIVVGLPAIQFYFNSGVGTSEPSIGSTQISNPSPNSLTDGSGERQNENANIGNPLGAQAIDFPIPMQSSPEMDHSIVVGNSSTMKEQSSGARSNIHVEDYSETRFFATSPASDEMRRRQVVQLIAILENPFTDGTQEFEDQNQDVNMGLTEEEIMMWIGYETFESVVAEETPENKEACCICKEEYVKGEEIGRLDCAHKFHIDCIKQWLGEKNVCPICRRMALMPINESVDEDDYDIDDEE